MATKTRTKSDKTSTKRTRTWSAAQKKGLTKVAKMMRGIDLCMMTTHGERASLHARPMSNNGKVDFDGDVWFFSGRDTAKVRELGRDPAVSLAYTGGTKKAPMWIALDGKATIVRDVETKRALWVDQLEQWFEDGPDDPEVVVIHVSARRVAWWSYDDEGELDLA